MFFNCEDTFAFTFSSPIKMPILAIYIMLYHVCVFLYAEINLSIYLNFINKYIQIFNILYQIFLYFSKIRNLMHYIYISLIIILKFRCTIRKTNSFFLRPLQCIVLACCVQQGKDCNFIHS